MVSIPILVVLILVGEIRMQRVVGIKKEIAEAHRQGLAAEGLLACLGQTVQIQGLGSQTGFQRLTPDRVV